MSHPALHLLAFSPPLVNRGVVSCVANFGTTSALLTGSEGIMCDLARAILLGCGQLPKPAEPARGKAQPHKGPNPRHEKFRLIHAELQRDSSHGRQKALCLQHGVHVQSFLSWRRSRSGLVS